MIYRRLASLGAVLLSSAVLLGTPPADAACPAGACIAKTTDEVRRVDPGDGVLCTYVRLSGANSPYIWTQTQSWGSQHPDEWDYRVCYPI